MAKKDFKSDLIKPQVSDFDKEIFGFADSAPQPDPVAHAPAQDVYVPFSTKITAALYMRVKQLEYWGTEDGRLEIKEIVEEALNAYLNGKAGADRPLPDKELKKIKRLK